MSRVRIARTMAILCGVGLVGAVVAASPAHADRYRKSDAVGDMRVWRRSVLDVSAAPVHRNLDLRLFWTGAAIAGFMTHLILDELYSVDFRGVRLKKSFGTALKFWSTRGAWPNISTYGKLTILLLLAWGDPMLMDYVDENHPVTHTAQQVHDTVEQQTDEIQDSVWR